MFILIHLFFMLFSFALYFCGSMARLLIMQVLKGLVLAGLATPGFQSYLERADFKSIKTERTVAAIKGITQNPLSAFLLRKINGLDVLIVNREGHFRSLLHKASSFNNGDPSAPGLSESRLAILLLDEDTPLVPIRFAGPVVILNKAHITSLDCESVVLLTGKGEFNAKNIRAPILFHDAYTVPREVESDTASVELSQALDFTRIPLLKLLKGEALADPSPVLITRKVEPRSIVKFLWHNAKFTRGKWFIGAEWILSPEDLQVLVDQKMARSDTRLIYSNDASLVKLRLLNPRISTGSDNVELKFDLAVTAKSSTDLLQKFMQNPFVVRDISVRTERFGYDPGTSILDFGRVDVTHLDSPLLDDPEIKALILNLANSQIRRQLGSPFRFDLTRMKIIGLPILKWLIRRVEMNDGRLRVTAAIGPCEKWLQAPKMI